MQRAEAECVTKAFFVLIAHAAFARHGTPRNGMKEADCSICAIRLLSPPHNSCIYNHFAANMHVIAVFQTIIGIGGQYDVPTCTHNTNTEVGGRGRPRVDARR